MTERNYRSAAALELTTIEGVSPQIGFAAAVSAVASAMR